LKRKGKRGDDRVKYSFFARLVEEIRLWGRGNIAKVEKLIILILGFNP
jgi:hypothetical protein